MAERRVAAVDFDLRQQRDDVPPRQQAAQLLLDQVTDHALGLRAQYVQRVRVHAGIRLGLQRQQSHLRPVAVGDDDFMVARDGGHCGGGARDILALHVGLERLAAFEQGVAAEGNDDFHGLFFSTGSRARSTALHRPGDSSSAKS